MQLCLMLNNASYEARLNKSLEQQRFERNGFLRMDPVLKKRWVEALRSGVYAQARKYLRVKIGNKSDYCCLGVLCKITDQDWNRKFPTFGNSGPSDRELGDCKGLPRMLLKDFFGGEWMHSAGPYVITRHGSLRQLAALNDEYMDFLEIADLIDDQL